MFGNRKEVCLRCRQFRPICEEASLYSFDDDVQLCQPCWGHLTAHHGRDAVRKHARNVHASLKKWFDDGLGL